MKKINYLLITFILLFMSITLVSANEINRIDVTLTLDENGNGHIKEVWDVDLDKGTELYKPMGDMGNSVITNYTVDMDGMPFTYQNNWDTERSMNAKAYSNGINYTDDGIELCFGMTDYGKHIFTLNYDVSKMIYNVKETDDENGKDVQMLYWKFINDSMDPAPKKITISISGPTPYSKDLPVWAYGYEGYAYVDEDTHTIEASNIETRDFKSSEYAVLLVKYPSDTFKTENRIDNYETWDEAFDAAEEGKFDYNKKSLWDYIVGIVTTLFFIIFSLFVIIAIYIASKDKSYVKTNINMKDINPFRDIPCDKNILNAYYLAKVYNLYNKKEDLFGAALLKWLLDGTITIREEEKQGVFKKKTITTINLQKDFDDGGPLGHLYSMLRLAAGENNILESDELEKWSTKNYNKLYDWFTEVEDETRNKYIAKGLIQEEKKGKLLSYTTYVMTPNIEEEAFRLAGVKKFLKEVSEIHEKRPIEVNLWEYYLMYAQIFGIAKEVAKQFKDLYPEIVTNMEEVGVNYGNVVMMNNLSANTVKAASAAKTKAESYSAGGGGSSFGGGGGGSFGGGSGGGAR